MRCLDKKLLTVFILLGLVSLFADMTYEGARGVSGAYLKALEGTAVVAGAAAVGEFIGYIIRFFSGYIADKLRKSSTLWGSDNIWVCNQLSGSPYASTERQVGGSSHTPLS